MKTSFLKLKMTVFGAAVIILLLQANDVSAVIVGIRYSNLNEPVLPLANVEGSRGRFGAFAGAREKNSLFLVGLDYDRHKEQRGDTTLYARRFTLNFGYRYQLFPSLKVNAMKINPFIGLHYFKSYGKFKTNNPDLSTEEIQYQKDMLKDSGGWLSFGVEYYFAPSFALGGEAGVRYSRAESKAYGYKIKTTDYTSFAAILLSFYWR